jgi:Ca2+/Na+ antiporter
MIKAIRHDIENQTPLWRLWCIFFVYTASTALMVQLILLPNVFPAWHAGDGLLIGIDSYSFHHIAVDLAKKIHAQGWSAWELRPDGQASAGIAGAVYALTAPKPWIVVPINAALHATATLVLLRIVQIFLPNWRKALWCVLPFLLYPSAMTWYTQNHKDGYFILGSFMFIYGWIMLAQPEAWRNVWWRLLSAVFSVLLGVVLVWIVRPYGVQMMQGVSVAFAFLLTVFFVISGVRGQIAWQKAIIVIFVVWAVVVVMTPLTKGGISAVAPSNTRESVAKSKGGISAAVPSNTRESVSKSAFLWKKSDVVPSFLENKFYALAEVRKGFNSTYPNAGSNIDINVSFHSVWEIIVYLPRAAEIAFLSPFPSQWLKQSTLPANTMMRRISAVEMVGVYLAFIFLPYAIWHWRRQIEIWLILSFCSGMMLIYAIGICNVGTLYRFRYGYLMILVGIGVAGIFAAWEALRFSRKEQDAEKDTERVR